MKGKLSGGLCSTVVGSFPFKVDRKLITVPDWREADEIRKTCHKAVAFQLDCGIEFPSDGQFYDMVEMYIRPLMKAGFLNDDGSLGSVKPPKDHPSTKLESELEAKARHGGALGLRVPVTGPFTLGYRVKTNGKSLIEGTDTTGMERLADAVGTYCEGFDRALKNSIISVDEPVLPFIVPLFGENFVRGVLNRIFGNIKRNYSCMHVCGDVRGIKDLSLSLGVEILDHEFQGTDNSGVYSKEDLVENEKLLSYGVINTNPRQIISKDGTVAVETVDELMNKIDKGCENFGQENLLLSPDCGFGGWRHTKLEDAVIWRSIKGKLANMVKARDIYLEVGLPGYAKNVK